MTNPGTSIAAERGSAVVCIPIYGQHELFVRCFESVLAHTTPDVTILVADDASPDRETERYLEQALTDDSLAARVRYLRQERNLGFVGNVNAAFAAAAPADVVILNSDCEVAAGWFTGLRNAAYSDSLIATATALTNHGTIVSVTDRAGAVSTLPDGRSVDDVADVVRGSSLRLWPRIPTAVGHCVYIRRSALDLVGDFDLAFSPGYGEEVDFSQRCVLRGLVHVAADDVFVFHLGGASFKTTTDQQVHASLLAQRYPYYPAAVRAIDNDSSGPLGRAREVARVAITGLSVTVDARCLGPTVTGTQIQVIELIHALHRTGRVPRLRAVVPARIAPWFLASLRRLNGLELLIADDLGPEVEIEPTAIVHRPYQVFDPLELDLIARLGDRFIVTHQDLISYRNPGYSRSFADWNDFHRVTRLTLSLADEVLFFSHHAASDALSEQLVDERRAHVAHLGVDHRAAPEAPIPARPGALPLEMDDAFVMCLGTNFRHKNRVFALELLAALHDRHQWAGSLVFAGPHAASGTSENDEARWLAAHPELRSRTIDLGQISDAEKAWLFANTRGVVFPSVYEGFGLVPFEAVAAGAPCFFAWQTALRETLPEAAATIEPWDAFETAGRVYSLLTDAEAAAAHVARIRVAAESLTWDATAAKVLDVYELAVRAPARTIARLTGSSIAVDGLDLPENVYRGLRAILASPPLRGVFFWTVRATYTVGHLVRRGRLPERVV